MATDPKEPAAPPKKAVIRCDKNCTYVGGGKDPQQCKNRCSKPTGHILSCKCRTHEMQ